MFGNFLLNEGLEMEIKRDMSEVVGKLDAESKEFATNGIGYRVVPGKGVLGAEWRMLVKPVDRASGRVADAALGFILIRKLEDGTVSFKIPPRSEWSTEQAQQMDPEGKYFASFILHVLNTFQKLGYVELPGPLPVE